jgi:iron complex transport system substrate-binding protein
VVAVVVALGCGCEARTGGSASGEVEGDEERAEVVTGGELPESPERIVSLAPNVTETLFALGLGDRVVGVTKFCDYPKEAGERPSVGSFANPDLESILARKPDLVIGVISGGKKEVADRLGGIDVPYGFVRMYSVEDTFRGIGQIGRWAGAEAKADSLVEAMKSRMTEVTERWSQSSSPEVLLVYGRKPLVAAGPGTFGHQLLERAGGRNALAEAETRFPRLDIEKVVELDPDLIVDMSMGPGSDNAMGPGSEVQTYWDEQTAIPAVKRNDVVLVADPAVLRPGPRLPEALSIIARSIYEGGADDGTGEGR